MDAGGPEDTGAPPADTVAGGVFTCGRLRPGARARPGGPGGRNGDGARALHL